MRGENRHQLRAYWFPRTIVANGHKPGGLKQQGFALSQFLRLEIKSVSLAQNQGANRDILPSVAQGRVCFLSLSSSGDPQHSLACGHITPNFKAFPSHSVPYLYRSPLCVVKSPS